MRVTYLILLLAFTFTGISQADEGFWTFDNPPTKVLNEKYDFNLTQEWLDHVRLSSVRFSTGGSASFVSSQGLVLTNYHVGLSLIQKMSTPEMNYVADGFVARTQADEIRTPDLEINILESISDVTERVKKVAQGIDDPAQAAEARKSEIARIEKEETDATGLRCDVITMYNGAQYKVYRYKKYTDVRLVFAPEMATAYFGGIYDNYSYPRWSVDYALFRVYENDMPLQTEHYLKWKNEGAAEHELVFISGNPGFTDRQNTVAQLEFERDYMCPLRLRSVRHQLDAIYKYAAISPEHNRQMQKDIFGAENLWTRFSGWSDGLRDSSTFNIHVRKEQDLREKIKADPILKQMCGSAWDNIEAAYALNREYFTEGYLASGLKKWRGLFSKACQIVQYVVEVEKPNDERLENYRDSNLESLQWRLFSPAPVYLEKEETLFKSAVGFIINELGSDHELVHALLQDKPLSEVTENAFSSTKLGDVQYRKQLIEGGIDAIEKSDDPLIIMARAADPIFRKYQSRYEDEVESVVDYNNSLIADAMFQLYGTDIPPDANFTLRLSIGPVEGYPANGTFAPYKTTLYGMFDRAASFDNQYPFTLPKGVAEHKGVLDMSTPYNFVFIGDSVGGNSGSPVINKQGELVGLLFDGNSEGIIGNFIYTSEKGRDVAVHPAIMTEFLSKIYDADHLVDELMGK